MRSRRKRTAERQDRSNKTLVNVGYTDNRFPIGTVDFFGNILWNNGCLAIALGEPVQLFDRIDKSYMVAAGVLKRQCICNLDLTISEHRATAQRGNVFYGLFGHESHPIMSELSFNDSRVCESRQIVQIGLSHLVTSAT